MDDNSKISVVVIHCQMLCPFKSVWKRKTPITNDTTLLPQLRLLNHQITNCTDRTCAWKNTSAWCTVMCGMTECRGSRLFLNAVSTVATLSHSSIAPSQASLKVRTHKFNGGISNHKDIQFKTEYSRNDMIRSDHGIISRLRVIQFF